ncbi:MULTISPECIES: slr1957 family protein [Calothrix]|uniref:Uncharacterized protein n=2 Tax=Calothrix TaxID=1186 RepID=A0ABR8A7Q5_9CYAN|nr:MULTISPECIES: hypothetical protein [Calothrix]MBD2196025.1 hypothetical protein [Calothrix parietina FACHB-288]MBD2224485.1 hypothetical protein [Calothrix anomala FACHB-343]
MMNHYAIEWIEAWCRENGWTDLFVERRNNYWAFPPGCVMPEPIPVQALRLIKAEKGLTAEEKWWSISAIIGTVVAVLSTVVLKCPMPLVFAFAFNAITVAQFEMEDV